MAAHSEAGARPVNRHAGPGSSRVDLFPAVLGVVGVAVDIDRHSGRAGDVDGLGGALLGTQPAREYGALPGRRRPGDGAGGHVGRQDRVDADDPAPGAGLERRYRGHRRRPAGPGGLPKRCRHRLVRGQVERMHHRRTAAPSRAGRRARRRRDCGPRRTGSAARSDRRWRTQARPPPVGPRPGGPERPVERARESLGVDSGVDHLDPRDLRPGGGVDVHVVSPAGQSAGQIGHEGLRTALLRLADGRHERGHDGDLHGPACLTAASLCRLTGPAP